MSFVSRPLVKSDAFRKIRRLDPLVADTARVLVGLVLGLGNGPGPQNPSIPSGYNSTMKILEDWQDRILCSGVFNGCQPLPVMGSGSFFLWEGRFVDMALYPNVGRLK
jgi:hypothetical protein